MKIIGGNRLIVILLALAGVLAIGVLAAGISDMEFREPEPFYFEWPTAVGGSFSGMIAQMEALPLEQVILFWSFIIIFTLVIMIVLNPRYRWKILMAVVRAALFFIFLTWAMKTIAGQLAQTPPNSVADTLNNPQNNQVSPPVFSPPSDVPWISYLFSLAIMLGILLIGWWLWNMGRRARSSSIRHNIAAIARETLDEIADGRDFGDTVTTCYVRMNKVVSTGHGIQRQDGMTPTEFASRLESAGLPGDPVRRLTRLFEAVRYGAKKPGQEESTEAITCLNAIVAASGGIK